MQPARTENRVGVVFIPVEADRVAGSRRRAPEGHDEVCRTLREGKVRVAQLEDEVLGPGRGARDLDGVQVDGARKRMHGVRDAGVDGDEQTQNGPPPPGAYRMTPTVGFESSGPLSSTVTVVTPSEILNCAPACAALTQTASVNASIARTRIQLELLFAIWRFPLSSRPAGQSL